MFNFFVAVALMFVSYLLTPKPKGQNASVQEGSVPTASADANIPVIFGDVDIDDANVVWWGDPRTKAIKSSGGK